MILGELFYYNKTLDELSLPLDLEKNLEIELAGLPNLYLKDYKHLGELEVRRSIRDKFAMAYTNVLLENQLFEAAEFWSLLIGPKKAKNKIKQKSFFQSNLLEWLFEGSKVYLLDELLKDAQFSTNQTDFALYYGLKVLLKFSNVNQPDDVLGFNIDISKYQNNSEVGQAESKPQLIVLTQDYFSPLFINLNCVYLPISADNTDILENIDNELLQNSEIKMIFIDSHDNSLAKYLRKNLPSDVIVSNFGLEGYNTENFFDEITKKTLGIKLITE